MKILIAEDEPNCRLLLKRLLEDAGHEVIECTSGQDVLGRMFAGELPQLLFLDWMMPEVDGLEVCRRIRARKDLPYTHIVLLTSRTQGGDVIAGLRAGANDYLTKPLELEVLQTRLAAAIQMIELSNLVATQRIRMIASAKLATLGEMAGGIAHEINNPLAILLGQVERIELALEERGAANGDTQRILGVAKASVARIAGIVKGLQLFSAQGEDEPIRDTSVRALFESTSGLCTAKLRSLGIELAIADIPEYIAGPMQKMQLCQVLLNLIQNSVDALTHRTEKWVGLDASEDTDHVFISVTDSGAGIPEENRPRLMQPFFTTKPVGKGTGLGLSTARGIVAFHGGKLTLDTNSMKTRFVITLPKAPRP